jgi:hypothetical protein
MYLHVHGVVFGLEKVAVPSVDFGQQLGRLRERIALVVHLNDHHALIKKPFDQCFVVQLAQSRRRKVLHINHDRVLFSVRIGQANHT